MGIKTIITSISMFAKRGGTKTIFVGGRTFRASGGRLISETQFKEIRRSQ